MSARRLAKKSGQTAIASATVIAARLARTHDPVEMTRMVLEKQAAAMQSAIGAQQALMRAWLTPISCAANWVALSEAMLKPYHLGSRANARRLTKRRR